MAEELKELFDEKVEETEVKEKKEKKELTPRQKAAIFAARLILFIMLSMGGPVIYIMCRFKPFTASESTQVGFAGFIVLLILLIGIAVLIGFYLEGMKTKYSFLKQVMSGIVKVILPIVGLLCLCWGLSKYLEELLEILIMLIPFEFLAILVNPLPKWAFDNNVEGLGNIVGGLLDKIKGKEEEKK